MSGWQAVIASCGRLTDLLTIKRGADTSIQGVDVDTRDADKVLNHT